MRNGFRLLLTLSQGLKAALHCSAMIFIRGHNYFFCVADRDRGTNREDSVQRTSFEKVWDLI
ncbi:hypothetical protein CDAR_494891, partial [Caerostris darwini]